MMGHFTNSAFAEGPILQPALRAELEQLVKDMETHTAQLEKAGVNARATYHPTVAEGREPRKATGKRGKKCQGRKKFPTAAELKKLRGRRTTGGVPLEDEIGPIGLPTGGAVPLSEGEKASNAESKEEGL